MRLIDADEFLDRLRGNVLVDVTSSLEDAIDMQPVIDPSQLLLGNCQGCVPGEECLHCMRAYSDCYYKP